MAQPQKTNPVGVERPFSSILQPCPIIPAKEIRLAFKSDVPELGEDGGNDSDVEILKFELDNPRNNDARDVIPEVQIIEEMPTAVATTSGCKRVEIQKLTGNNQTLQLQYEQLQEQDNGHDCIPGSFNQRISDTSAEVQLESDISTSVNQFMDEEDRSDLHIRTVHENKQEHGCSKSKKSFGHKGKLKNHFRLHDDREKPFPCPECSKSFAKKGNLTMHLRIHAGSKPFSCNYCSSAFTQSDNLTTHMRIHTKEKPFQCSYCKKEFSVKSNCRRHEKSQHPQNYETDSE